MITERFSPAEPDAVAAFRGRPALARGQMALALQGSFALPLAVLFGPTAAAAVAGIAATCLLLGQLVERTAPQWRTGLHLPAAWATARQAVYPAIATAAATLLTAMLAGGA